jgi:hypothetical protein
MYVDPSGHAADAGGATGGCGTRDECNSLLLNQLQGTSWQQLTPLMQTHLESMGISAGGYEDASGNATNVFNSELAKLSRYVPQPVKDSWPSIAKFLGPPFTPMPDGWVAGIIYVGAPGPSVQEMSVVGVEVEGSFSIINWEGYPGGPKPTGPFRIVEGQEYESARESANQANQAMHRADPSLAGKQIHEVHPVKFGGSPTNPGNKIALTPQEHAAYTTWWNRLLRIFRSQ